MPGVEVPVERAGRVRVSTQGLDGIRQEVETDGLQHEIDHLDGIKFIDRVWRLRRDQARRANAKLRRLVGAH